MALHICHNMFLCSFRLVVQTPDAQHIVYAVDYTCAGCVLLSPNTLEESQCTNDIWLVEHHG